MTLHCSAWINKGGVEKGRQCCAICELLSLWYRSYDFDRRRALTRQDNCQLEKALLLFYISSFIPQHITDEILLTFAPFFVTKTSEKKKARMLCSCLNQQHLPHICIWIWTSTSYRWCECLLIKTSKVWLIVKNPHVTFNFRRTQVQFSHSSFSYVSSSLHQSSANASSVKFDYLFVTFVCHIWFKMNSCWDVGNRRKWLSLAAVVRWE